MAPVEYSWTFGQFILGMFIAGIGFIIVLKAAWMLQNFGSIPFAEKNMRTEGGSRAFYKLIGLLFMIGGIMHATGLLGPFVGWAVAKTFGGYFQK